jgi:F420-dependent oxidoreductase-like protein
MRLGLQIPIFTWSGGPEAIGPRLAEIGRTADEAGFASLWVMDHLFQIPFMNAGAEQPMLEGYGALHFLAGVTRRARLGTMVTAAIYRPPGLLVKAVTTLDVLSGGRAWLGIGAGWYEREALGLGLPFPPLKERFERLEEALQIAQRMWSDDLSPFRGKHYHLAEPLNHPQALSRPHPPILIGGTGETKTLRLVAQYADACNFFASIGPAEIGRKLDILKRHCDAVGRDYAAIERTVLLSLGPSMPSPADLVESCRSLARAGVQHVVLSSVPGIDELTPLETVGREVIPAVAEL